MSSGSAPAADFVPVYTRVGLAALRNAQSNGLQATIAALALGRGGPANAPAGYTPDGSETALKGEFSRAPIIQATPFGTGANDGPIGFDLVAVLPRLPVGSLPAKIREVGVFLDDGTLLCVWSDPVEAHAMGDLTPYAALVLSFDLYLNGLPADALNVTVQELPAPENLAALFELLRAAARNYDRQMRSTHRLARRGIRD